MTRINPGYVLTDEDKISCLPIEYQDAMRQFNRVAKYAQPCVFTVETKAYTNGKNVFRVSLRAPGGNFSTRESTVEFIEQMSPDSQEKYVIKLVSDMKRELGVPDLQLPEEIPVPPTTFNVVNKRNKGELPTCPEHKEKLAPAEPGVLKCPILGCETKMVRKSFAEKVGAKKTPVQTIEENIAKLNDRPSPPTDNLPPVDVPPIPKDAIDNAMEQMNKLIGQAMAVPPVMMTERSARPFFRQEGGRTFIAQQTPAGLAYVDVTECHPEIRITRDRLGLMDSSMVLLNIMPR
jgi:hypothetical protein